MLREFLSPCRSDYVQIILSFMIALFFSPLSKGLAYFIIFLIIWEGLIIWSTKCLKPAYKFNVRLALNVAGILGWILGRWLYRGDTGYVQFINFMSKL